MAALLALSRKTSTSITMQSFADMNILSPNAFIKWSVYPSIPVSVWWAFSTGPESILSHDMGSCSRTEKVNILSQRNHVIINNYNNNLMNIWWSFSKAWRSFGVYSRGRTRTTTAVFFCMTVNVQHKIERSLGKGGLFLTARRRTVGLSSLHCSVSTNTLLSRNAPPWQVQCPFVVCVRLTTRRGRVPPVRQVARSSRFWAGNGSTSGWRCESCQHVYRPWKWFLNKKHSALFFTWLTSQAARVFLVRPQRCARANTAGTRRSTRRWIQSSDMIIVRRLCS